MNYNTSILTFELLNESPDSAVVTQIYPKLIFDPYVLKILKKLSVSQESQLSIKLQIIQSSFSSHLITVKFH
jgi:hypothetical protein